MVQWLGSKGVALKTESDGRMFPVTDDSQTIIDCFLRAAIDQKIRIEMNASVNSIQKRVDTFLVRCSNGMEVQTKRILVATGGNSNVQFYTTFVDLGHSLRGPIPSLFTFNEPAKQFTDLMGVAVKDAEVRIATTKFS